MTIELNGETQRLRDGATVAEAVEAAGGNPEARGLAVALDGEVLPREQWQGTTLREGQSVEVVRAIQGG